MNIAGIENKEAVIEGLENLLNELKDTGKDTVGIETTVNGKSVVMGTVTLEYNHALNELVVDITD